MGAVQALTDPIWPNSLWQASRGRDRGGSLPRFYQVVLKVRAMDDTPVDITYLFHRELQLAKSPLGAGSTRKNVENP